MSEPPLKITVATVCYNAADVIERTIHSVEEQDYPHVEHVIIDGNSADTTLEIVHHYQERNSVADVPHEITCLSEPDEGLYDAMNKALTQTTGQYVLFLNAGDTLHSSTTLSHIARVAQQTPTLPAVIYGDTDIVDAEGRFLHHRRLTPPRHLTWRSLSNGMLVCHQAFFARTDLAQAFPYDRHYRYSADFDWCIRLLHEAKRRREAVENAHIIVANYLSEGLTTRHHKASLIERFHIMVHHYGWVVTLAKHAWFVVRAWVHRP